MPLESVKEGKMRDIGRDGGRKQPDMHPTVCHTKKLDHAFQKKG